MHKLRIQNTEDRRQKAKNSGQGLLNADRKRKGLSIIEVISASVLLIIAMVPILRSLTKAHMYSSEIEMKTQSLVYAQSKLDETRARSVYNWSSFTASNVAAGNSYLCNITDDGNPTLKTITVSAGKDQNGNGALGANEIEVTLISYIAKRW